MAEQTTTTTTETDVDYKALYEQAKNDLAKQKSSNDKLASENAEYKRQQRESMTDEAKRNAELAEREKHYAEIERENALYKYKASLGATIKDEATLNSIAEAYADGKIDLAIKKQTEYLATQRVELEKQIKSELLKTNPQPNPQNGSNAMTRDEIMAISDPVQRQKAIADNIHLFK